MNYAKDLLVNELRNSQKRLKELKSETPKQVRELEGKIQDLKRAIDFFSK